MNESIVQRVREAMVAREVDAYLAYTPSNIFYLTGVQSFFVSQWRRMLGTVVALVSAAEDQPVGLLIGDFERGAAEAAPVVGDVRTFRLWVETRRADELQQPVEGGVGTIDRPEQFDTNEQDDVLWGMLATEVC